MRGLGGFGLPMVTALASYGGAVVAAGRFSYAGGPAGRTLLGPIARWDGQSWSTLGTPPYGPTLGFLARGDTLYAAGTFASYPYPSSTPVMMFDGANWTALDTLSLWGTSLAVHQGALYVGGRRRSLSDPYTTGVYRWSGSQWQSLGALDGGDGFPGISALIEFGGRLVAAGAFDSIAGVPAKGIAAWNGDSWIAMDSGIEKVRATSLAECEGVLYAGGQFYDQDHRQSSVLHWDGAGWRPVPATNGHIDPTAFACANGKLYAGGYVVLGSNGPRGVMSWDGSSWSSLGSGTNGPVLAMAVHEGALFVGGAFSQAGGRSSSAIARWDLGAERRTSAMLTAETGIPNPFRVSTSIAYRLTAAGHVRVSVYDLRGRRIKTLEDASRPAGTHFLMWDGHSDSGEAAPSGVYFLRLDLPGRSETRRVVRLR